MDSYLIEYLKSGKAWVLVGSGPSSAMGYPSWKELASYAIELVRENNTETDLLPIERYFGKNDYPKVFEEVQKITGMSRMLHELNRKLKPKNNSQVYDLITKWPVPVYLTTNYDDEIQRHLAKLNEFYKVYSNSEDDFAYMHQDYENTIFKIHGDLTTEKGLILTSSQYKAIIDGTDWEHWRTKMTSVFQLKPFIIIGLSLTDENLRHVLEAAKKGAGVINPICWIAPDASNNDIKIYLEKYRIRVISYDNSNGSHSNLVRLLETVSEFIPSRTSIRLEDTIAKITESPLGNNAAAPGFYVFNKLANAFNDFDEKRVDIVLAALQSVIPQLKDLKVFSLQKALELAGWPNSESISLDFQETIVKKAVEIKLFETENDGFKIGTDGEFISEESRNRFHEMKSRFKGALKLRVRKIIPELEESYIEELAVDIEAALVGYFKSAGLSLATTIFSRPKKQNSPAPSSIIKFISKASAKYNTLLMRQAFSTASVSLFTNATSVEREYLGRVCQGFFAYHALGIFGEVANERLKEAQKTVWLVDSNAQIIVLAFAAPTNALFINSFSRLSEFGIRFFTTDKLCRETFEHLRFANNRIKTSPATSSDVIAAATGNIPYKRSNQFLQGFLNSYSIDNNLTWQDYMIKIFKKSEPRFEDFKTALNKFGIEVVDIDVWPGYSHKNDELTRSFEGKIVEVWTKDIEFSDELSWIEPYKKAAPEAEAIMIIKKERLGDYYILSEPNSPSPAWFISDTAVLNNIDTETGSVTWSTEGFLKFASTITGMPDKQSADRAFQTILIGCAQSGLNLLPDERIEELLGSKIEQASIDINQELEKYSEIIKEKYGETPNTILAKVPKIDRTLAELQLANEILQEREKKLTVLESQNTEMRKRIAHDEKLLKEVEKFREQIQVRKRASKRNSRKQKAKQKTGRKNKIK